MISYDVISMKLLYALISGCVTIFFMIAGFRFMSGLLAIDISHELREKNVAVGLVVMGMFICVGAAIGLSTGLSLH